MKDYILRAWAELCPTDLTNVRAWHDTYPEGWFLSGYDGDEIRMFHVVDGPYKEPTQRRAIGFEEIT